MIYIYIVYILGEI